MFETISGHSDAPKPERRTALAAALGLHAAIIGGAILYAQFKQPPPPDPEPELGKIVFREQERHRVKSNSASTPATAAPIAPKKKPFKPRTNPIDPASVPVEPEQIAAPVAPENPGASDNGSPTNILGTGDAGQADRAIRRLARQARSAPTGGGEQVLIYTSQMTRPVPNCEPPAPIAPQAARQFGIEGRVVVQYVVHADGRVGTVNVMNQDAPPMYAEAVRALAASGLQLHAGADERRAAIGADGPVTFRFFGEVATRGNFQKDRKRNPRGEIAKFDNVFANFVLAGIDRT